MISKQSHLRAAIPPPISEMEGHLQNSPKLGNPIDGDDAKYVSGLSTILVATIQEAKDRISQIESIFCSQLFPNFQSKSDSLQKTYSEARKTAEEAYKEKEKDLRLQIERIQLERQQLLEENQSLKLEMEKPSKEQEEKINQLLDKITSQHLKIGGLERKLKNKSEEVYEARKTAEEAYKEKEKDLRLQIERIQLEGQQRLEENQSLKLEMEKSSKEQEEKINQLLDKITSQHLKIGGLERKLKNKSEEVDEARKTAEEAYKEKEKDLRLQIERIQLERQQRLEESQSLKLEMEKPSKEQEEKINQLLDKIRSQHLKIGGLERKLKNKSEEVDEGMELQNRLIQMAQSKDTAIVKWGKQLNEYEDKTNELLANVNRLEKKVDEIQEELRSKTEKVAEGKQLQENLFKKIESLALEIVANEKQLNDNEKEKKLLMDELERMEDSASGLQKELEKKTCEVEEGRKLQNHLLQQIDLNNIEMSKNKQQLEECEKENKLLLAKVIGLEGKINDLQVNLGERRKEGNDSYEKLLQQNDMKASELLAEKKKRRTLEEAFKKLISNYNFLLSKCGLTTDNMLPQSDSLMCNQNSITSPGKTKLI
jgi:cold shock CspA family protein